MALQKNKREIGKDKQILMISRFYKPAFVTIFIFFGHIINEKEEKMQEKFCLTFEKNRKYNNHKRVAGERKSSFPAARFSCIAYRGGASGASADFAKI